MTPREADRLIKSGKPMAVRDKYGCTGTMTFVARDRWTIESSDGGKFERADLEIVKEPS